MTARGLTVLFCGSRDWRDEKPIQQAIGQLADGAVVVHGGARGADSIAARLACRRGLAVKVYPASWGRYGRAAGVKRNQQMLDEERPDVVYAFRLAGSRGTSDMIDRARRAEVEVVVVER